MFESAELGHTLDKLTFEREVPPLREALLDAQYDLLDARKFAVIVVIGGVDGAGKGETVNVLNEWMDPRHIHAHAYGDPLDEERERPPMWRFWRDLPPRGKLGIFFGSWYTQPILRRAYGKSKNPALDQSLQEVVRFERMLTDEGTLVLKFWLHLSKAQQKQRLESLASKARTRWRVTDQEWRHFKLYDRFREVSERALRRTSTPEAPWIVVEGVDHRYRSVTVARAILEAMRQRLEAGSAATPRPSSPDVVDQGEGRAAPNASPPRPSSLPLVARGDSLDVLNTLDLTREMDDGDYDAALDHYQSRLNLLSRAAPLKKRSVVLAFEGPDAAGKGGSIRRITAALDARQYRVIPIAAPTDEERAQPYLWRFWRQLPRRGQFAIFDRSWYGRVLVERVEGFASEFDWSRAYGEINDYEEQLVRHNTLLLKFWLQISQEEQLKRFAERTEVGFKRFKLTDEDWRNRQKWDHYQRAAADMVERTSTDVAPWTLVEANDKNFARIKILKTVCERLEAALEA